MLKTQLIYSTYMTITFDETFVVKMGSVDLDTSIDKARDYMGAYGFEEAMITDTYTGEILAHLYED